MPSWKTAQSKRKVEKKSKLAFLGLGLILGILLLAQVFKFTQILFSPWQLKEESKKNYLWSRNFNLNLAVRSDGIYILSFSPKEEWVSIIKLPDNTFLDVPGGLDKWQVASVYDLGGVDLLKNTLTNLFGLPIDGFIEGDLEKIKDKNLFSLVDILPGIKTDLTLMELIKLKISISFVRFDKFTEINLEDERLLEKETLADGTNVLVPDPVKLDSIVASLADPVIKTEHKTVAIFNSTNHPNLAQKAARIISNLGADVIIISNSQKELGKTVILGDESKTLERLKQIFGKSDNIDPNLKEESSSRAQINIFLGEDYFNKQ